MPLNTPHFIRRSRPPAQDHWVFGDWSGRTPVKAFTFAEIVVVGLIISILAAIAIPNFLEFQTRARVSRTKAELIMLRSTIEQYRMDCHSYPLNRIPGKSAPEDLTVLTTPVAYMTLLPPDTFDYPGRPGKQESVWFNRIAPYQYLNAVQLNPEHGLQVRNLADYELEGFIPMLLWSIGPDRQENTLIPPENVAELLTYNPTNGTTSRGDIYQRTP